MYFGHHSFKEPDNKDKGLKPLTYIIIFLSLWFIISMISF